MHQQNSDATLHFSKNQRRIGRAHKEVFAVLTPGMMTSALFLFTFAYAHQLYKDREKLRQLFIAPRSFKTMRVFRFCSFVGAIPFMIACIDFYGAHGVHPRAARVALFTMSLVPPFAALGVGYYHELAIAFTFMSCVHCCP